MKRIVLAVGVVAAIAALSGQAAMAGPYDGFAAKCQEQFRLAEAQMPYKLDLPAVCRCQAEKLKKKGYDPDQYHDLAKAQVDQAIAAVQEDTPDPEGRKKAKSQYVTVMQDGGMAFSECVQAEVRVQVEKRVREQVEAATKSVQTPRAKGR